MPIPRPTNSPLRHVIVTALLVVASMSVGHAAVTLQDADSYWRFDVPTTIVDGTSVTNAQLIDSSVNNHVATGATRLTWVTTPATGPYGGQAIGDLARGISFNPITNTQNAGSAVLDDISAATFSVANGTVSGSSALTTRFMWDGNIPGSDDGPTGNYYWLVRNGYSGAGSGYMFGLQAVDATTARLIYFTYQGSGGTSSATSTFTISTNTWYDIAMVLNDGGDSSTTVDNAVNFYAYSTGAGLQTSGATGIYISGAQTNMPQSTLLIGSENSGTGTGNNKKAFDGTLDYLAIFDVAMTQSEVLDIFAAPEPSRGLLMMLGFSVIFLRRRK